MLIKSRFNNLNVFISTFGSLICSIILKNVENGIYLRWFWFYSHGIVFFFFESLMEF